MQDLMDPGAEIPHALPRRQSSFAKANGDLNAKSSQGKGHAAPSRTPTAAGIALALALGMPF